MAHQSQLPDLGNEFRAYLSLRDEKIIGDHYMREVRAAGLMYPDPLVHEYVRYVGHRLTPFMPHPVCPPAA
jgi:predicted Zn-dependent protease